MATIPYLGLKGQHIYEPEESNLSLGILRMPTFAPYTFHFNLENVNIPKEVLREALKQAEVISCDYDCKKDYTLHLFKKKDGFIGWLERKIVDIELIKDFETVRDGQRTALEDIPGYDKIATIVSKNNQ